MKCFFIMETKGCNRKVMSTDLPRCNDIVWWRRPSCTNVYVDLVRVNSYFWHGVANPIPSPFSPLQCVTHFKSVLLVYEAVGTTISDKAGWWGHVGRVIWVCVFLCGSVCDGGTGTASGGPGVFWRILPRMGQPGLWNRIGDGGYNTSVGGTYRHGRVAFCRLDE